MVNLNDRRVVTIQRVNRLDKAELAGFEVYRADNNRLSKAESAIIRESLTSEVL